VNKNVGVADDWSDCSGMQASCDPVEETVALD